MYDHSEHLVIFDMDVVDKNGKSVSQGRGVPDRTTVFGILLKVSWANTCCRLANSERIMYARIFPTTTLRYVLSRTRREGLRPKTSRWLRRSMNCGIRLIGNPANRGEAQG